LSEAKTKLYSAVEKDIINKGRSDSFDPFGIKMVEFDGTGAANEYVLVIPGGFVLQLWMMFSTMREKLIEKTEDKFLDFFRREAMLKYLVQFLLQHNLHDNNMVLYLSEGVREKVESTIA